MPSEERSETILWLVRHGQTNWNLEGRYQGHTDIPLNPTGLGEAAQAGQLLAHEPITAVYSSDLQRARQTAQAIADCLHLPVQTDIRLREINLGEWEGRLSSELHLHYAEQFEERRRAPLDFRAPKGETLREVIQRIQSAASELAARHPGQQIVLVSHGLVLSALALSAQHKDASQAYQHVPANGAPLRVTWQVPFDQSVVPTHSNP